MMLKSMACHACWACWYFWIVNTLTTLHHTRCSLQAYNGFNMVVGDLSTKQAAYVTNRGTNTQPVQLQPGLHGISNGSGPQQEWFKVQRGKSILQDILNLDLPSSPSQPPLPSSTRRCRAEDHAGRMISEHARDPCLDTQAQQASRQEDPQLADMGNSPSKGIRSCQKRTLGKHEPQEDTARPSNCSAQQGAESRSPDLLDKQAPGNTLMSIAVKPDHSGDLSHSAGNQQASGCSDSATRHPSPCDQALTDKASSSSVQTAACQHQEHARCRDPGSLPWDAIFKKLMQDRSSITDDSQLPATGMPQQMERMLSPIFIKTHTMLGVPYGTRTQTVIAAWHDGHVAMRERNLASNGAWVQAEHMFRLPLT